MDDRRFDGLLRVLHSRPGGSRRALLAVFAGLGLPTASALEAVAGHRKHKGKGKGHGKDKDKIHVCHCAPSHPSRCQTLRVPPAAVPGHLGHGDTLGPCGSSLTQPPPPTGGCTPLLQICWPSWLGGNPCCDTNAECLYVNGDVPAFFCLDQSKTGCTSDAECRARFTDPNIACLHHFPATCRSGVARCCQRKTCPTGDECEDAACCNSGASLLQNVCCAAGKNQRCDPFTGCVTQ